MAEKSRKPPGAEAKDEFPETQVDVLRKAAAGDWAPFLEEYLRPCWREVVLTCRQHNLPLSESDDLYQELMLRLLRSSGLNREVRRLMVRENQDPSFRGNLPGRYLYLRHLELPVPSARFRTYLKRTIRNLVLDAVRKAYRRPQRQMVRELAAAEPWIEESITHSLDRRWVANCLLKAAFLLRTESRAARSRGKRRLFETLYLASVEHWPSERIARKFGLHRTTVSDLLSRARSRLAVLLRQTTGVTDSAELRELLAGNIDELRNALAQARADYPD